MDLENIEAITSEIRQITGQKYPPIDLIHIAQEEGILLAPGDYGEEFNGRIEFHHAHGKFILFYPKDEEGRFKGRARFSIAHELGHYYLPEHRRLLVQGGTHNSKCGFICDNQLEREADEFAAYLLVPQDYLRKLIRKRTFLTLKDLLGLANELQVSATAMAIRYVKMTPEPCAVILSQEGQQKFYMASEEMEYIGFQWRGRKDIPWNSASAEASKKQGCGEIFEKESASSAWFSKRKSECEIWEEAFPLGYTGLVLTMLSNPS